jgi:predicted ATP-dependent endonuclease of OLD family
MTKIGNISNPIGVPPNLQRTIERPALKLKYTNDKQQTISILHFTQRTLDTNELQIVSAVEQTNSFEVGQTPQTVFVGSNSRTGDDDILRFSQVDKNNKKTMLLDLINSIIDDPINDISINFYLGRTCLFVSQADLKLPIHLLGDGIARCISIILAALSVQNGIVLIDEIENGLHHSIYPKIINTIIRTQKEIAKQFFITTHNAELLSVIGDILHEDLSLSDLVKIIRFESSHGQTKAYALATDDSLFALKNNLETRD